MADSNRSARRPDSLGAFLPPALLFGGLFLVWCLSVLWLRQLPADENWARQAFPLLLWIAAIALWAVWQKQRGAAQWAGLLPIGQRAASIAGAAFVLVFAWHAIRLSVGRTPSGLLTELPPEIFAWMIAGIFVNELLFHGVLQTRLTELLGPKLAIPITAVAVLLFRLPSVYVAGSLGIDAVMLSTIFLLSLLAGVLRHVSGSLWPAIALQTGNALGALL